MSKARLEAFSDGVIAILITIMVLELRVPHGADWAALRRIAPAFFSYVLSFVFLGIYWSNHHHMLQLSDADQRRHSVGQPASAVLAVDRFVRDGVDGRESLCPAAHGDLRMRAPRVGNRLHDSSANHHRGTGTRLSTQGRPSATTEGKDLRPAVRHRDPLAFVNHQGIAEAIYVAVALIWLVPDRRIENHIKATTRTSAGAAGALEDNTH